MLNRWRRIAPWPVGMPFSIIVAVTASCRQQQPRQPDLPSQPDRWVNSITLDTDSKVEYIGKTKNFLVTSAERAEEIHSPSAVRVGDSIEGLPIAAIKCSFFWRDAFSGNTQFMWRGRWGCMAGRSKQELETAIDQNGDKRFDYIHVSPVSEAGLEAPSMPGAATE